MRMASTWHHARVSHFLNDRASIVTEAIDAEVSLSNGALRRLDGYPAIKVVIRADWDRSKVALVSGGGAGHEPAHVGFVGEGMLTAAVCGEIFASPSVDAVLAAILAVTGAPGCLLVVKNYTGDRLNFGLAAEKARALGVAVEMVIVGDDVALPASPRPRGVAGTLFVHKVAGHFARAGKSLAEVKDAAERVARATVSIGVSLSSCTIPGQARTENRIAEGDVELGLGIHGEPGAKIMPLPAVSKLGATMMGLLEAALDERGAGRERGEGQWPLIAPPIAVLANDLGGVPPIEMALATRAILEGVTRHDVRLVFGPARLMTSLDMKGFSVSALSLRAAGAGGDAGEEIEDALLSAVGARRVASRSRASPRHGYLSSGGDSPGRASPLLEPGAPSRPRAGVRGSRRQASGARCARRQGGGRRHGDYARDRRARDSGGSGSPPFRGRPRALRVPLGTPLARHGGVERNPARDLHRRGGRAPRRLLGVGSRVARGGPPNAGVWGRQAR